MQLLRNIPEVLPQPCIATIGFFDGVHRGHRYLIEQVREVAVAHGFASGVVTFPVHPRKVVQPEYHPELLTTYEEKVALLIKYLRGMNDELNIPHCIAHYGADSYPCEKGFVPEEVFLERLPEIAKNAIADACTGSNPRIPTQEEMEKLLKCCYYDTEVDF